MELIESLTHFDTKFFQTFMDLVWRPGLVVKNYNVDKRDRYFPPVRIYFFTGAIFFIILNFAFQNSLEKVSEKVAESLKNNKKDTTIGFKPNVRRSDSAEFVKLKALPNLTLEKIDSLYRSENKILGWYSKRFVFSVIKLQKGELMLSELFQ